MIDRKWNLGATFRKVYEGYFDEYEKNKFV